MYKNLRASRFKILVLKYLQRPTKNSHILNTMYAFPHSLTIRKNLQMYLYHINSILSSVLDILTHSSLYQIVSIPLLIGLAYFINFQPPHLYPYH